jgi:hypothetical protein
MAPQRYLPLAVLLVVCILGILQSSNYLMSSEEERELSVSLRQEWEANRVLLTRQLEDLQRQLEDHKKENEELLSKLKECENKNKALLLPPENKMEKKETILQESKTTVEEAWLAMKHGGTDPIFKPKERLETTSSLEARHPVCQQLGTKLFSNNEFVVPSAPFVWTEFLSEIHTASDLLPNDPKYAFHDFTAHLLQLVSSRLPRTTQTLPRTWDSLHAVLDIGWKRYQYFQAHPDALQPSGYGQPPMIDKDYPHPENIPRPIQILILGGSLLQGTNCRKMIRDLNIQMWLPLKHCNWGHRLGAFLNQVLQAPLVEVTNIGVGGTNTETGSILLHHELIPPQAQNADIIINGYSTNDMHVWTMEQAGHSNATLGDQVRSMVEDFYRNATRLGRTPCNQRVEPLLIYLDDYLGNEQREILTTMEGSSAVQSLARYYGFPTFSYADLVRDWVYGDTHETWFSPEGWFLNGDVMEREIHPQLGMHVVASWVVAYNMLNMVANFCSIEPWRHAGSGDDNMLEQSYEAIQRVVPQLPDLRNDAQYIPKGKPRAPPKGLPPRLTKTLLLDHVSELWAQEVAEQQHKENVGAESCQDGADANRQKCPFAWVTRIRVVPIPGVADTELENDGDAANAYWKAHAVTDFGDPKTSDWAFQSDHMKIGAVPMKGVGSELLLEIPAKSASSTTPVVGHEPLVDTVTLFYMKSYGEKWMDSTIRLEVKAKSSSQAIDPSADWVTLSSIELTGWHAKSTSETFTETLRFGNAADIQQLQVAATLIKGETFKIMGLLACRLGD